MGPFKRGVLFFHASCYCDKTSCSAQSGGATQQIKEQGSPPAGKPQEAYRPQCDMSKHNLSPGGGAPHPVLGYPSTRTGVPPEWARHQLLGYPSRRMWDQWQYYGMEMGYIFPGKNMGLVELLWDGDGVPRPSNPRPPRCGGLTHKLITLPYPFPRNAGDNRRQTSLVVNTS